MRMTAAEMEPLPEISTSPAETSRQRQRAALQELVALTRACAVREREVDEAHVQARETAESDLSAALQSIDKNQQQQIEAVTARAAERHQQLRRQQHDQLQQLNTKLEQQRREIDHARDVVERDVKKQFEQA